MNKIKEISTVLSIINDGKLIEKFLKSILTKKEIHDISSRWALVKLLNRGLSQRKIAKKLNLSLCKITRGSKELKRRKSAFKQVIEHYEDLNRQSEHQPQ